jgi:hypothetical protein
MIRVTYQKSISQEGVKMIKKLFMLLAISLSFQTGALAMSIQGKIEGPKKHSAKALYIFVKPYGSKRPMPVAVRRYDNPKFPLVFEIGPKNVMIKGTPFKGPFQLTVRLSPSGDALDKTGLQKTVSKAVSGGTKNINVKLH